MSHKPPTPPANLPTEIVNTLNESSVEQLRDVATYAEALAEHKEREAVSRSRQIEKRSKNDQTIFRTTSRSNNDHDQGNQRQSLLLAVAGG